MDVIASTAFGIQLDSQKDKDNAFVKHASSFDFSLTKNPVMLLRCKIDDLSIFLQDR